MGLVVATGSGPAAYGTQTMRRSKGMLIDRRARSLRAVELLLGHAKLESTVRYLGSESTMSRQWQLRQKHEVCLQLNSTSI